MYDADPQMSLTDFFKTSIDPGMLVRVLFCINVICYLKLQRKKVEHYAKSCKSNRHHFQKPNLSKSHLVSVFNERGGSIHEVLNQRI